MFDSGMFEKQWVHMYHQMENHHVLEQFSSLAGVEPWNVLASEDFSYNPSKMMSDHSLIIPDCHLDHKGFITMQTQGLEEVVLDSHHVNQLFFHDPVPNELIVEHNVEVGNDETEIVLIPNALIKQEDIIEGEELVVGSNEVIIDDNMGVQLGPHHFEIGSSIDISPSPIEETSFEEDTKLIIDDQYNLDVELQTVDHACGECGLAFRNRTLLKRHIKSSHARQQKVRIKREKGTVSRLSSRYACPSCDYSSQRRDKLDKHMEKHVLLDGVHPCGKRRHKPETLPQRHRHNAEEYHCSYCPYTCTVYRALKKHHRVHTSGTESLSVKLSCKICGKDRPTEADLVRHMKKHRKEEHFLCDLCEFTSVQLKKIIQHRRMHTGEKPHLCPHCSYRSARRDNLRSHVRRMHKRQNMYIDTFNPNEEKTLITY